MSEINPGQISNWPTLRSRTLSPENHMITRYYTYVIWVFIWARITSQGWALTWSIKAGMSSKERGEFWKSCDMFVHLQTNKTYCKSERWPNVEFMDGTELLGPGRLVPCFKIILKHNFIFNCRAPETPKYLRVRLIIFLGRKHKFPSQSFSCVLLWPNSLMVGYYRGLNQ